MFNEITLSCDILHEVINKSKHYFIWTAPESQKRHNGAGRCWSLKRLAFQARKQGKVIGVNPAPPEKKS